jgi:hypothetical protein
VLRFVRQFQAPPISPYILTKKFVTISAALADWACPLQFRFLPFVGPSSGCGTACWKEGRVAFGGAATLARAGEDEHKSIILGGIDGTSSSTLSVDTLLIGGSLRSGLFALLPQRTPNAFEMGSCPSHCDC